MRASTVALGLAAVSAISLLLLSPPVAADAATSTSGNAMAFALDPETGKIIGGGAGGKNNTGRRLSQDLSTATSGNGFAFSSGGGKTITSGSGSAPGGAGRSCDSATLGNAFAFVSGASFDWTDAASRSSPPPVYNACRNEVVTFYFNNPPTPVGVTQFQGPGCPSDFGKAAAQGDARALVAPTQQSTSFSVKLSKPGRYFFADPGHCSKGAVQEIVVA